MNKDIPYLTFYKTNNISPVRQDISDLSKHFSRRNALYRHLGIIPSLFSQKDVLEFGPGSGYNSIFTASLNPREYVLVDGNPTGIQSTKELLKPYQSPLVKIEIHETNALDFSSNKEFDIVIAEGLVPLQLDPSSFAQKLAMHTKIGGAFILTTCNYISFFSEAMRRLMATLISPTSDPLEKRINSLLPIFQSHAKTLKGMSRPIEDWLIDTLIIPFEGKLFSLPDAINALGSNFDFYNSSPKFVTDWRWYKDIHHRPYGFNELAIESYYQFAHHFIDYRSKGGARDKNLNIYLEKLCIDIYEEELQFERSKDYSIIKSILRNAKLVSENIKQELPESSMAIEEIVRTIREFSDQSSFENIPKFQALFGRAMQYASFIRVE